MSDIEGKNSFKNFPEDSADRSCYGSSLSVDFDLWDKLIEGKEDKKSESEGDEVLDQKVISIRENFGIDMIGDKSTFFNCPMNGCPDGCYRQRKEHDDTNGEHDDVFHQPVVKKRFLIISFEDEIDSIDKVRK